MSATEHLGDPRAEAAIEWMVEMGAGAVSERQLRLFEVWLQADPENEVAWIRLQEGLMPFGVAARGKLPVDIFPRRGRLHSQNRRAFVTGVVGLFGAGTVGVGVTNRFVPLDSLLSDYFTFTAQQEHVQLSDGSEIVLAPRTSVNIRYEAGLRGVQLLNGEILLRTVPRSAPFQVEAGQLTLRTTAGVFLLERRNAVLSVTGVQGVGEIGTAQADESQTLNSGDLIEFENGRIRRLHADLDVATAWLNKLLIAKDRPLAALINKLRPYFPGVIRLDPAVELQRVTGVFSLKDPNAALDALADSLDLSLTRVARYWVNLGPAKN